MSAAKNALKATKTAEIVKTTNDLAAMPTEALKERLTSLLARTADDLREMASIVGELESRGEDLSALRLGIVDHLRRIAAGQLLPEVVVRFSGFPALLRIAIHLPLPDQRKLADGEPLDVAVWRDGSVDWRRVDPLGMTRDQLQLVFAGDRIRTQSEQISVLESQARKPQDEKHQPSRRRVKADQQRGGLVIGRAFAPLADVLSALADLRGTPIAELDDELEVSTLMLKLPANEHTRLKILAAQSGTTMVDLVRRALYAHGLTSTTDE